MAWIQSHQSLARHPKMLRLAARVGVSAPQVVGHLHYLWWWTLEYAPDGDLSRFSPHEIAVASEWSGDPNLWSVALRETGWLDPDGHLHDWDDYSGKLAQERARERERKRAERARAKVETRSPPPDPCPEDVRRTSPGRPAPDKTTEDKRRREEVERVSQVGAGQDQPPEGFPKTAVDAARGAPEGAPAGFAEKLWHLAVSRGWRDARNIPIRSWTSYLAASLAFAREAESRPRSTIPCRSGPSPRVNPDHRLLQEVIHAPTIRP